jgi:hypothetical protein
LLHQPVGHARRHRRGNPDEFGMLDLAELVLAHRLGIAGS